MRTAADEAAVPLVLGARGGRRRPHLGHLLIDTLVSLRLGLRRLVGGQASGSDLLVDALMRRVLQCSGDVGRILAVRLGDLRQRLTRQLLLELRDGYADGRGGRIQVAATAARARAAGTAWASVALAESAVGGQAGVGAGLADRRLQRRRSDAQAFGERVDERLVLALASGLGRGSWRRGRRRLGGSDANRRAAKHQDSAACCEPAFEREKRSRHRVYTRPPVSG